MNRWIYKIGIGACIIAGVCGIFYEGIHRFETYKSDKSIREIQQIAEGEKEGEEGKVNKNDVAAINFEGLKKKNKDIAAWVRVLGTKIDYPVMYTDEQDYYLHRDINGNYDSHGMLYFAHPYAENTTQNILIYGHHMRDGSMFADVMKYKESAYLKKHNKIYLFTESIKCQYKIVGAFLTDVSKDKKDAFYFNRYLEIDTREKWDEFWKQYEKHKIFDLEEEIPYKTKLLMLSTCEYSTENGRMVIVAKQN